MAYTGNVPKLSEFRASTKDVRFRNAQIFEIIQRHELGGVWLGLIKTDYGLTMDGDGDRLSMGSLHNKWSSTSTSNHVMCVFMDDTSLEDSVCTTVSL